MRSWLRRRLLGIPPDEASFGKRGFWVGQPAARQRLEQSGRVFLEGYHAALGEDEPEALARRLGAVAAEFQGFAFEGAAMGLALLDGLTPWKRNRLRAFLDGPGRTHIYMVHVGAGWAIARLPWQRRNLGRALARVDPLLRWLALDGYGFHEGYFYGDRRVVKQEIPEGLSGYARRAFDQGLGRSLWFLDCADVTRIPTTISAFPPSRHGDLWSGVGLACGYAGGVERAGVEALQGAAGPSYAPHLTQGAVFAAKARQRAGNLAPHTDLACRVLCGLSADASAAIADDALQGLQVPFPAPSPVKGASTRPGTAGAMTEETGRFSASFLGEGPCPSPLPDGGEGQGEGSGGARGPEPAYETWRRRIRERFIRQPVTR